jgi:hypothetical protein
MISMVHRSNIGRIIEYHLKLSLQGYSSLKRIKKIVRSQLMNQPYTHLSECHLYSAGRPGQGRLDCDEERRDFKKRNTSRIRTTKKQNTITIGMTGKRRVGRGERRH